MIQGMHAMFRSSKPAELRAFLAEKLSLPSTDVGGGWLIFDVPEADVGVHPTDGEDHRSGEHDVSFYTRDLRAAVAELKARGVTFDQEIEDHGYGLVTYFTMPGNVKVQLYQPKYKKGPAPRPKARPLKSRRPPAPKGKAKAKALATSRVAPKTARGGKAAKKRAQPARAKKRRR